MSFHSKPHFEVAPAQRNVTLVEFTGVTKRFGSICAVKDLNLTIPEGEFLVFVGPSGSGKTTVLRLLAGLDRPDSGEIRIAGHDVVRMQPKDRDIAMVFQNFALYPNMTVEKNISFGLRMRSSDHREIQRSVRHAAELLGIEDLLARYPRQLSGGQRQRVAIGRAIVRKPKLFLFDEPLSSLDAQLRMHMRAEIKSLHRRLGVTTIYVTHDQAEAMALADRLVILKGGEIEQIGPPLEVYNHPHTWWVAQFLGTPTINLFQGTVRKRALGTVLECEAGFEIPLVLAAPIREGTRALYGIRPEDCALMRGGLPARVAHIEQTGFSTVMVAEMHGQLLSIVARQQTSIRVGDEVGFLADWARGHLFDAQTGKLLIQTGSGSTETA